MKKFGLLLLCLLILTGCSSSINQTETDQSSSIEKNRIIDDPNDLPQESFLEPEDFEGNSLND